MPVDVSQHKEVLQRMKCIGCDAHKRYSVFVVLDESGRFEREVRINHDDREEYRRYLRSLPAGSRIALETVGNWYWMVDEMEGAGHIPQLTHAGKAKLMMGNLHKSDKLDGRGLCVLMRNGTLPTVWIPPAAVRDERELLRTRMFLVGVQTRFKNRMQAMLDQYGLPAVSYSDIYGEAARPTLLRLWRQLPRQTAHCWEQQFHVLGALRAQIRSLEMQIEARIAVTPEIQLVMTEPGIGRILSSVVVYEVGSLERFPGPACLASYSGTVPRLHASGGKTRFGPTPREVNHYLKWAFVEAANVIVRHRKAAGAVYQHAISLYERVRQRRGHGIAAVAVARHLAEATYWILKKRVPYKTPAGVQTPVSA